MKLFNRLLAGLLSLALVAQPALAVPQPTPAPINDVTNKTVTPTGGPPGLSMADALRGAITFRTHAQLVAGMTAAVIGNGIPTAFQQGYYESGDGGAMVYSWAPTSTATADGILTLLPSGQSAGTPGRLVARLMNGTVLAQVAGAKCDFVVGSAASTGTDDTVALNALSSALQNNAQGGGRIETLPGRPCKITAPFNLGRGVIFQGSAMPLTSTGGNAHAFVPSIVATSTGTVGCNPSSEIRDAVIWKAGLAEKPATFEDTATYRATTIADGSTGITNNGSDCHVQDVAVIGFQNAMTSMGGARLVVDGLYFDGANGLDTQHNADTSYVSRVRGYPFWSSNLGNRLGAYAVQMLNAGTGNNAGDVFTVVGGTLSSGNRPTTFTYNGSGLVLVDTGDYTVSPQTFGAGAVNSVVSAGSGGPTSSSVTASAINTSCPVPPTFNVTTDSSGKAASATVATAGSCTNTQLPPNVAVSGGGLTGAILNIAVAKNPLTLTTSGTGTGMQATISVESAHYRPGTCARFHDQMDGGKIDGVECQEFQVAAVFDNVWNVKAKYVGGEGGANNFDHQPLGVQTLNCASDVMIYDLNADNEFVDADLQQLSAANGGACSGGSHFSTNSDAKVTLIGGHYGYNVGVTLASLRMGAYSTGTATNTILGWGGGNGYSAPVQLQANAGLWRIETLQFDGGIPTRFPDWISVDPSATPPQSIQFQTSMIGSLDLNGDMVFDQANEGAGNTGNPRMDRWRFNNQYGANIATQRVTSPVPNGVPYALKFTNQAVVTPTAAQSADLTQQIEGSPNTGALGWGTAFGNQAVASWWLYSATNTGVFTRVLKTAGQTASIVLTCNYTVLSTWKLCQTVVPAPPALSAFAVGSVPGSMALRDTFDEGSGANLQAPAANTWYAANYNTVAGAISPSTTAGLVYFVTGVHLTPGPFAGPYVPRDYAAELAMVQRFYSKSEPPGTAAGQNKGAAGAVTFYSGATSGSWGEQVRFPVPMYTSPVVTVGSTSAATANCYDATATADAGAGSAVNTGTTGFFLSCAGMTAVQHLMQAHYSADSGQ